MTSSQRPGRIRKALAVAVAGATLGVGGAFGAAAATDESRSGGCRPTATDLRRAAASAQALEAQRPDVYARSPRPADYRDLRLAAEWAHRMSVLDPDDELSRCSQ
jgi:hypothetical protein